MPPTKNFIFCGARYRGMTGGCKRDPGANRGDESKKGTDYFDYVCIICCPAIPITSNLHQHVRYRAYIHNTVFSFENTLSM